MVNQDVRKVLIDNGSSVDIIFRHALRILIVSTPLEKKKFEDVQGPVYGFGNHAVPVQGTINIPTTFAHLVLLRSYHILPHMKVKFPTPMGPGELVTDPVASQYCYSTFLSLAQTQPKKRKPYGGPKEESSSKAFKTSQAYTSQIFLIESLFSYPETSLTKAELHHTPKVEPGEPVENIELIEGDPTQCLSIGSHLQPSLNQELIQLLREFPDIFAWKHEDMPGLDESVTVHRLHVDPNKMVVKQKRRNFAPERQQAINEEINKLLTAKFINEIQFLE
ncbi:uncharacterized protein LOC141699901 [Apium graveolens]|uniref:uncharacterized protein LOC141699901 n=1 Tax=Apium graveolens TaxID=4045 RepID=UPI003D7B6519